jgi:hypothetical protein
LKGGGPEGKKQILNPGVAQIHHRWMVVATEVGIEDGQKELGD